MFDFSPYSTVIFDLDGTLVDSVPDLALALNAALTALAYSNVTESQVRSWVGNGSVKLVSRALASKNVNNDAQIVKLHQQFLTCYQDCLCEKSTLYPGVKSLLDALMHQGKTLVLLTNKPIQFVPELLETLGIASYFSLLLGGDSLIEKKPHPLPILHILEQFNLNAQTCLMVGDSRSDILCAQQAGVDSLALMQGYHQGVDLKALKPTYICDDIVDILENRF